MSDYNQVRKLASRIILEGVKDYLKKRDKETYRFLISNSVWHQIISIDPLDIRNKLCDNAIDYKDLIRRFSALH